MEDEIRYKNLSTPLKIAVIGAWIVTTMYALVFIVSFLIGVAS